MSLLSQLNFLAVKLIRCSVEIFFAVAIEIWLILPSYFSACKIAQDWSTSLRSKIDLLGITKYISCELNNLWINSTNSTLSTLAVISLSARRQILHAKSTFEHFIENIVCPFKEELLNQRNKLEWSKCTSFLSNSSHKCALGQKFFQGGQILWQRPLVPLYRFEVAQVAKLMKNLTGSFRLLLPVIPGPRYSAGPFLQQLIPGGRAGGNSSSVPYTIYEIAILSPRNTARMHFHGAAHERSRTLDKTFTESLPIA